MPHPPTLSEALRQAALNSGLSIYALAKTSGIPQPSLHHFLMDGRDLRISNADKLAAALRLELTPQKPAKGKE